MHISTKMKIKLFKEIMLPEGIEAKIDADILTIKGQNGELSKKLKTGKLDFKIEGNKITLGHNKATKNEKKTMNTIVAHIKNMIKGIQEKFEYTLKICYSHFPFTVSIEGKTATIKNFLGEKVPRHVKIPDGVEIKSDKEKITITSVNKETAGQAAANFETATKTKGGRDKRIFQDGLYIINKAGKEI